MRIISEIGNSSILTVTKPGEWNGTYLCTTNLNTHQRSHVAKVTVLVKSNIVFKTNFMTVKILFYLNYTYIVSINQRDCNRKYFAAH